MRTYSKSDVQFHSDGYGRERRPAVNVKVSFPFNTHALARQVAKDDGRDANEASRFADWWEQSRDDGTLPDWLFEVACEHGWEDLQQNAVSIFLDLPGVSNALKVYSEGRSGGWAVVDGLPPFESWDASMLGKWRRFEKWARQTADDVPYQMCSLALINIWEDIEQQRVKAAREHYAAEALTGAGPAPWPTASEVSPC